MDLEQLTPALLSEHLGSHFEVMDDPSHSFSLTLAEVVEKSKTEHSLSFSLFFHGPLDRFIPQGIHKLAHPKLGHLEIFLVPIAREKDGYQYEAAFNKLFK